MGGFGSRPTLITRSPIAGSFGQLAFQDPVACARDIRSSLGDFVLAVSDPTEREDNVVRGNMVLNELVSQQHRGLEVIEAETGRQDNGIADVRNLERPRHRMWWTVEHHKIVKLRYLERLRDRSFVQNGIKDRARSVTSERKNTGGHFVQHYAEREQIRTAIQFFSQNLLGGHVRDSAEGRARAGEMFRRGKSGRTVGGSGCCTGI